MERTKDIRKWTYETVSEKDFQASIIEIAELCGFQVYHTWNSLHSAQGYPDLTLCKQGRIIFAELKSEKGKLSIYQKQWLDILHTCPGVEAYVWKPSMIDEAIAILKPN